mmetsp:Transcript_31040/g.41014  ORF Transcript_31040/g.41014 Transcript_31040/m.41014 type:complete len:473 (+) Transcript_31040:121-1539(+)|eukprot:CAMPEP_0117749102 /NCGR_PEP_ID=MMETSP0947-20121206/9539_1 /TAXON_ID=44440 /ORGANISM="Chattonella subsalsa, Strain CCMP2191" /LENGTH=472 /DNA_ID=CAMNT_0005566947 /DNA_START=45 /DNA_END=1463 /DNA_ORIENTATION=+
MKPSYQKIDATENRNMGIAWVVLSMLLLLYSHNQWVRSLIYCLVNFGVEDNEEARKEYMNIDLNFNTGQYGMLASFGFVTLYTIFCLFAGRASDIWDKKIIVVAAALVWSLATIGQGMSFSFAMVFGLRVVQGAAQAYTSPASIAMVADYFPSQGRATANAVFSTGLYVGFALASVIIPLDTFKGWRFACIAVGALGVVCSLVAWCVFQCISRSKTVQQSENMTLVSDETKSYQNEEEGRTHEAPEVLSIGESLRVIGSSTPAVLALLGSCVRMCAYYALTVWGPPYWRQNFPEHENDYGVANAFVVCVGGVVASIGGGIISDSLVARYPQVRAWIPAIGCFLAIPFWTASVCVSSFYLSIGILFIEYLFAESWFGPFIAILQDELPLNVQGITQGLFGMAFAVGNCSPAVMGIGLAYYDIRTVLIVSVGFFYMLAGTLFLICGFSIAAKDNKEKEVEQTRTLSRKHSSFAM